MTDIQIAKQASLVLVLFAFFRQEQCHRRQLPPSAATAPPWSVAWVRAHCPETAVLVLMAHDEDAYLAAMVAAGAAGFVVKEKAPETVVAAVRAAGRGEVLFSEEQRARARRWREEVSARWESLTEREVEVLRLLARGWDNARIAEELVVSEGTVKNHVTSIYAKLNVHSRAQAVAWAWEHGVMGEE